MTIEAIRQSFPILQKKSQGMPLAYFDNGSTSLKPIQVIDAMQDYYINYPVNAGRGEYDLAYQLETKIDQSRQTIADFIHAKTEEIIFTTGTTMGLNMLAESFARDFLKPGDEIIITESDHAANVLPWYQVAKVTGATVTIIDLDDTQKLTPNLLQKHLSKHTKIVAFAEISNVLGTRNDVKTLTKLAHEVGAYVIVDGAQSVPHFPTNVQDTNIDFLVFSGHKMLGPTGIGVLYGKHDLLKKMTPHYRGGGMSLRFNKKQEIRFAPIPQVFEAGTQHWAGIIGLAAACQYLNEVGFAFIHQQETRLREYAIKGLQAIDHITIYNPIAEAAIIAFNIKGVNPQDAATFFNSHGIAVRSGQHCARNLVDHLQTEGTVRWSAYFYNTIEEVDRFIEAARQGRNFLDAYFK